MYRLSLVIPYRDSPDRTPLLEWVLKRYNYFFTGIDVCIADSNPDELFNRSQAINRCVSVAKGSYLIIADADVICDIPSMDIALATVNHTERVWAFPNESYFIATPDNTTELMSLGYNYNFNVEMFDGYENIPSNTSAIMVMRREAFESVDGFDERFIGWGYEDNAFFHSMNTMWGPFVKIANSFAVHLFHEAPHGKRELNPHLFSNARLAEQYRLAEGNRDATAALIKSKKEIR